MYSEGVLIHMQDRRRYDMSEKRRQEKIQDAIGFVGDDLLIRAKKKNVIMVFVRRHKVFVAAVLTLVLLATNMLYSMRYNLIYGKYVVVAAEYPNLMFESEKNHRERIGEYKNISPVFNDFYKASIAEFLSDNEDGNIAYSPVNVIIALSMLAEMTDGSSRSQILKVLGADEISDLRRNVSIIWKSNYDKIGNTCVLANSLWLDNKVKYKRDALEILAKEYYASSFYGDMGSREYNEAVKAWLNEQSGGLLEEMNEDLVLSPDTLIMMTSTLNFDDEWIDKFDRDNTKKRVFHSLSGDIYCDFMTDTAKGYYYKCDTYVVAGRQFKSGANMWFILPNVGTSVSELLQDESVLSRLAEPSACEYQTCRMILSLPKYDIQCKFDLIEGVRSLGIQDVFNSVDADFSPVLEDDRYVVGKMEHSVRVIVDENGAKAVAQTNNMTMGTNSTPSVILDRPFIFVIESEAGAPLFVGVINNPR